MKKNLRFLVPILFVVLIAQVLLVKFVVSTVNKESKKNAQIADSALPGPTPSYSPKEVVQVSLYVLRHVDIPRVGSGLVSFDHFMTPRFRNQIRDKALLRPYLGEDVWKALTDFDEYKLVQLKEDEKEVEFEIEVLSEKRLPRKLIMSVVKKDDLWLVDQFAKKI